MQSVTGSDKFDQLLRLALQETQAGNEANGDEAKGTELKAVEAFVQYCETNKAALSGRLPDKGWTSLQSRLTERLSGDHKNSALQNLVTRLNTVAKPLSQKHDPSNFAHMPKAEQVNIFQTLPTIPALVSWLEANLKTKLIALDFSNWKEAKAWKTWTSGRSWRAHDSQSFYKIVAALSREAEYHKLAQEIARAYFEQASDDNLSGFLGNLSANERKYFFELTGKDPILRQSFSLSGSDWAFEKGPHDFHWLLSRMPRLNSVSLSNCRLFTDDHLKSLSQCTSIKAVQIFSMPRFTGAGLAHLVHLKETLNKVSILKCDKLERTHVAQLGMFKRLSVLNLVELGLHDQDLEFVQTLQDLKEIDLSRNYALTDEVFKRFTHLKLLEKFILRDDPKLTGSGLAQIAELKNVRHLDFEGCRNLKDNALEAIGKLITLEFLNLNGCVSLTGTALRHIKTLINLRFLNCRNWSRFAEGDFNNLVHMKLLALDLSYNLSLTSSIIAPLAALTSLQILNLQDCAELDDGVVQILKASLRELNLHGCRKLTDQSLKSLGQLINLVAINLSLTGIKGSLQPLSDMKQLSELDLDACAVSTAAIAPLSSLPSLQILKLNSCRSLTIDCLDLFRRMPSLHRVELYGCDEAIPYEKVEKAQLTDLVHVSKPSRSP